MNALSSPEARLALVLSTCAGLSTGIGGALAIVRKPGNQLLAALLGVAIGVMATLSIAEMLVRNAMEHGWAGISLASAGGALTYYLVQPYLPDFDQGHAHAGKQDGERGQTDAGSPAGAKGGERGREGAALLRRQASERVRAAELLRLGGVMALTMTLHNFPEGLAVAFSSFTDFGPYMAMAIAIHNIPEGVIIAAPVFAATGSRWKAMAAALASGLSEPLGALIALVAVKPFVSEEPLHYILAFVGGIMTAVCAVELWPEARKCKEDARLAQGVGAGVLIMAGTLVVGV